MSDALHVDRLLAAGGCPWLGRRWSRAVGVAAVAAWEASGLSQSAWCREQGVAVYRLGYWCRRLAGGRERIKRIKDKRIKDRHRIKN